MALPVVTAALVIDLASLLIDKTDRAGKRLALPDMLFLWSALILTASFVLYCLIAIVATGRSDAPSKAWVDVPIAASIALQLLAVVCFPLVVDVGRAMGFGEPHPAAPLTKAWNAIDRFVSGRFRR